MLFRSFQLMFPDATQAWWSNEVGAVAGCSCLSEAIDLGSDWYWLDWFGTFNMDFDPWIYHLQHRFLYPFGTNPDVGIVFWDNEMGAFWWTRAGLYPYVYRFSDGEWLFYSLGSVDPRWFNRLSAGEWERYPPLEP